MASLRSIGFTQNCFKKKFPRRMLHVMLAVLLVSNVVLFYKGKTPETVSPLRQLCSLHNAVDSHECREFLRNSETVEQEPMEESGPSPTEKETEKDNENVHREVKKKPRKPSTTKMHNSKPLIVLFTTIKNIAVREKVHNNTITNWASLRPWAKLVLFAGKEDDVWKQQGERQGWVVREPPKMLSGLPVIKAMFLSVMEEFSATFYGYANSDILFDSSLRTSLEAAHRAYRDTNRTGLLLVGKRTNVPITSIKDVTDMAHMKKIAGKYRKFHGLAQDYFITTKHGFPWFLVPDFVVGRVGYDNWFVARAFTWDFYLLDVSLTVNAVHQTASDGRKSGWHAKKDKLLNWKLAGKFNYGVGTTTCSPWYLMKGKGEDVYSRTRAIGPKCLKNRYKYVDMVKDWKDSVKEYKMRE